MYSISRKSDSVVNKIHYSTFCAKCNNSLIVVFHEYFSQDGARELGVTVSIIFLDTTGVLFGILLCNMEYCCVLGCSQYRDIKFQSKIFQTLIGGRNKAPTPENQVLFIVDPIKNICLVCCRHFQNTGTFFGTFPSLRFY